MNLSAARVFVWDISRVKDFYVNRLGLALEVDGESQGFCVFHTGDTKLILEAVPADASAEDRALVGRFTGLSFAVDDIQAKYQALQSRGIKFSGAPELQGWGGWLATFEDPAGNGLQLVQSPVS
jgi:predicted enzyme related to lactoylglutathione lyase